MIDLAPFFGATSRRTLPWSWGCWRLGTWVRRTPGARSNSNSAWYSPSKSSSQRVFLSCGWMGSDHCSSITTGGVLSFSHMGRKDWLRRISFNRYWVFCLAAFNWASCPRGTGHTKQDDAVIARSLLLLQSLNVECLSCNFKKKNFLSTLLFYFSFVLATQIIVETDSVVVCMYACCRWWWRLWGLAVKGVARPKKKPKLQ